MKVRLRETRVRRAEPTDAEALTGLSLRSKRSNGYDGCFMAACREELTVTAERLERGEYWLAESDELLGYACLVEDSAGGTGEVHAFFVEPRWQGKGVGRLLWNKLRERARAKGLVGLHLDADPAAAPFYERLGFRTVGQAPSGSIPGRTLPYMTITLDPES